MTPAKSPPGEKPPESPAQDKASMDPEWISALNELMEKIDPKDADQALSDIEQFIEGEETWAEIQRIPRQMLFDLAERGYLKFKSGRMKEAEGLFRFLSTIDHKTAYYYTALGAIYQKQENYLDALASYTVAIELDPEDTAALVNRGEIYYIVGYVKEPIQDFDAAIALDAGGSDPWANRARFLKKRLETELKEEQKAEQKK